MTLSCPSCKSRFMIDPAVLLPNGRKVRCGFCGERWFQEPLPELEAEEAAADEAVESSETGQETAVASETPAEEDFVPSDRPETDETLAESRKPDVLPPESEAVAEEPNRAETEEPSEEMAADSGQEDFRTTEEEVSSEESDLPGSGAGSNLEEPWEDDSLAAMVAADLPEEETESDIAPAAAESGSGEAEGKPEEEQSYDGDSDFGAKAAYGAEEADESDWDSDWRGTQPLAEESLAEESEAGEEADAGAAAEYGEPEAVAAPETGKAEAEPSPKEETEEKAQTATQTAAAYDSAEALFEEPAESGVGVYSDQEEVQSWDDLEKAEAPSESEPGMAETPVQRLAAESESATSAVERAEEEAEESGPYAAGDEVQDGGRSVLEDLGIEAEPVQGDGEGVAEDAWETSLFAKKGTSRATILSPEDQAETPAPAEAAEAAETEAVTAESPETEPTGAEPTVYFDAEEEPVQQAESYDPGRALEEVAEPEEAAEAPVVAESKPIKTMSDYLVAAVDDDEIENKEEEWGVSELESFFRDEEQQAEAAATETPEPEAAGAPAAAAAVSEAVPEVLEASVSARAKFRRVMAAGATAAAAQEATEETGKSEDEDAAAELAAATQAKASGGGSLARGWALYFATLLALGSVFYFGRGRLLDFEPRMAELYKLVGL